MYQLDYRWVTLFENKIEIVKYSFGVIEMKCAIDVDNVENDLTDDKCISVTAGKFEVFACIGIIRRIFI